MQAAQKRSSKASLKLPLVLNKPHDLQTWANLFHLIALQLSQMQPVVEEVGYRNFAKITRRLYIFLPFARLGAGYNNGAGYLHKLLHK